MNRKQEIVNMFYTYINEFFSKEKPKTKNDFIKCISVACSNFSKESHGKYRHYLIGDNSNYIFFDEIFYLFIYFDDELHVRAIYVWEEQLSEGKIKFLSSLDSNK